MPQRTRVPQGLLNHSPAALRWTRDAKGLRQRELAKAVGISRSYLSELECGTRSAPPHLLNRIATYLRCPVTMLEMRDDTTEVTAA
ncbi:helix-turn-helix domain-containing protein [Lentzea kentuckyensis]|uniref:helix-turn-helix domain-containing protein n=1 Tax=Lentzea kentuckyensis TaxID=360086 RepID=UPI000A3C8675